MFDQATNFPVFELPSCRRTEILMKSSEAELLPKAQQHDQKYVIPRKGNISEGRSNPPERKRQESALQVESMHNSSPVPKRKVDFSKYIVISTYNYKPTNRSFQGK